MALDRIQVIQLLKTMKAYERQHLDKLKRAKKRGIRPSERAMGMAHYAMNMEALEYAINSLESIYEKGDPNVQA